jgi:hypothetical protein
MADSDGTDGIVGADGFRPVVAPSSPNRLPLVPLGAEGAYGQSPLIPVPMSSTPLDSGEAEDRIPSAALWAMKDMRHKLFSTTSDADVIRWKSGGEDADSATYAIDDGYDHCMVARLVGVSPDGCTYCLVTRVQRLDLEEVRQGQAEVSTLMSLGRAFTLCGVTEGSVANVVHVARYRRIHDVPVDYLPGSQFIHFAESP